MYHAVTHAKSGALDEALCHYKIVWTMFSPDSVVPALMDRTPGWHRLFSDKVAVIHVRDRDIAPRSCVPSRRGASLSYSRYRREMSEYHARSVCYAESGCGKFCHKRSLGLVESSGFHADQRGSAHKTS
jgi:hypothetical protein